MTLQPFYRFLSLNVWGNLPAQLQKNISKFYAKVYNKSFTKYIIKPYCKINYQDQSYLQQFRSASGSEAYHSFQDFFTRVYKQTPQPQTAYAWPCEGLLCDYGKVKDLPVINIKGDKRHIRTIFGEIGANLPDNYYFSNVFLHNNNYHRIHSPTNCTITAIERIEGELILLRPWVYKNDPSLPAMRNERVNIQLEDDNGRHWYLSIVGGPAVGSIVLNTHTKVGASLKIMDELGLFLLGSTCCIASPIDTPTTPHTQVFVGDIY